MPLLLFLAFLLYQFAERERARAEQSALNFALQISRLVDSELSRRIAMLDGLAVSQALQSADLSAFDSEARRLVTDDEIIILRGLDNKQYVNTQRLPGETLPPAITVAPQEEASLRAGLPVVSAVYASPVTGEPRVAVARSVLSRGEFRILAMTLPTTSIQRVVTANGPGGWTIGVGDASGIYVTHSRRHESVSGKPGLGRYLERASGHFGTFTIDNLDRVPTLAGFVRSPYSGWLFAANMPYREVTAPMRGWLFGMALIALATVATSLLLAYYYGRALTRAVTHLADRARHLGQPSAARAEERGIRELSIVSDALDRAADALAGREREREAAREREAFLASIFDSSGIEIGIVELQANMLVLVVANHAATQTFGRALKEAGGGNEQAKFCAMVRAAAQSSGSVEGEFEVEIEGRRLCYFGTFSRLDDDRVAFTCIDITAGHTARQIADARSRELELVLSTVPAGVWFSYDANAVRVVRNRYASNLLRNARLENLSHPDALPAPGHIAFLRDGAPLAPGEMPLRRAIRGGMIEDEEFEIRFWDGTSRYMLMSASALQDEHGGRSGAVAVALDITERKRDEEQKQLLLNELNHRVKNTLATVQSIAAQTLRTAATKQAAQHILTQRLVALAKAHDVLTSENWEGAWIRDILRGALAPYPERTRFQLTGEDAWLTPSLALTFAMALHELITNAIKYGALSVPEGLIAMRWNLQHEEKPVLCFEWRERGGPPVAPPTRQGFGLRLLERGFSAERGGEVAIEYAPEAPGLQDQVRTRRAMAQSRKRAQITRSGQCR